ncbi:hypothetical protein AADR41_04815 [Streptomyces sp. CLV115]|uniref:hypothetical protein n=1 Tax=Streptomyces sp. CLV115 TaxID=3138502 RepID=UPI00313B556B
MTKDIGAPPSGGLARFSAAITSWLQAHQSAVAVLAVLAVAAVVALAVRHRLRTRTTAADRHPTNTAASAAAPRDQRGGHCC